MEAQRELKGSALQQAWQVLQFHETRLNRISNWIEENEQQTIEKKSTDEDGDFEERVSGIEENLAVIMESIQNATVTSSDATNEAKTASKTAKLALTELKKANTLSRTFPTKLSVVEEKFRLLSEKVNKVLTPVENDEEVKDNVDDTDENSSGQISLDISE